MVEDPSVKRPLELVEDEDGKSRAKRFKNESDQAGPAVSAEPTEGSARVDNAEDEAEDSVLIRPSYHDEPGPVSRLGLKPMLPVLPPSLELVTGVKADLRARKGFVGEEEVGIIGYAGPSGVSGIKGVIKQRFTDFLVNEVLLNGTVLHLKDIRKPQEPETKSQDKGKAKAVAGAAEGPEEPQAQEPPTEESPKDTQIDLPEELQFPAHPSWTLSTTKGLRPHLSDSTIKSFYNLLVEGKDPPPKQDSGWGQRKPKEAGAGEEAAMNLDSLTQDTSAAGGHGRGFPQGRDRGRGRDGRGRGGRGGRGGGGGSNGEWWTANGDDREVLSQPMADKEQRAAAHKAVREHLNGLFETSSREAPGGGQVLVIKWARQQSRRAPNDRDRDQPKLPQYIHFTMHKSNRETQDALSHLARSLGCYPKDLTVCGTKDKRAVTVQRVCLKRGNRNLVSVWRAANQVGKGRRSEEDVECTRGDRGVRIGDLEYSTKYLDLGMLNGNRFLITLRNIQNDSEADLDTVLGSLRDRGFVNFYGMQRFGTSTVPTHVTGLHILRGDWGLALDSILSLREGEHPDCVRARLAWLEDQDYEKALQLMPRRSVAERSIWEFYKRGGSLTDKVGALSSIPRNLRTIYVHAYQSFVWNLITSERIKLSATETLVGDLVFEHGKENPNSSKSGQNGKARTKNDTSESSSSQDVKVLTEADVSQYKITDVVLPLPGWNVDYPSGTIGELYEKVLAADGLNIHRMRRDQREYSLPGGYRPIILRPAHCSWSHMRYTDPDIALVQSDEDKLLDLNPPAPHDPDGKFQALKLDLELGPSVYATMALREVTREETSTWHQIGLTMQSGDQEFKGVGGAAAAASGEDDARDNGALAE